ncbi:MAG: serine hydrolase, partial [Phycisphaeraceae bacterium]|nr:serine hydrolase [Phycisphaeraceae bacterium]
MGRQWAHNAGAGFSMLVARRGVYVVNQGFGADAGGRWARSRRVKMTTLARPVMALLATMLADQQALPLDAPVGQLLPALAGNDTAPAVTVGDLINRRFDLPMPDRPTVDLSARLAPIRPWMTAHNDTTRDPATRWALLAEAMENTTGKSLAELAQTHLLKPLDSRNLALAPDGTGGQTAAYDLGQIGQLLLNGGSWEQKRLAGPAAINKLIAGGPANGFEPWTGGHLSDKAFGHRNANGSLLLVDPEHQLIVVMLFDQPPIAYEPLVDQVLKTIAENLQGGGFNDFDHLPGEF